MRAAVMSPARNWSAAPSATACTRTPIASTIPAVTADANRGRIAAFTRAARSTGSSVVALATLDGPPVPASLVALTR